MSVVYASLPVTSTAPTASTATETSVSASASSVTLLASNPARQGAVFYNDSQATCNLKLGATASSTSYTVAILAGGYFELPSGAVYTGRVDAIWTAANGAMRITEY